MVVLQIDLCLPLFDIAFRIEKIAAHEGRIIIAGIFATIFERTMKDSRDIFALLWFLIDIDISSTDTSIKLFRLPDSRLTLR